MTIFDAYDGRCGNSCRFAVIGFDDHLLIKFCIKWDDLYKDIWFVFKTIFLKAIYKVQVSVLFGV